MSSKRIGTFTVVAAVLLALFAVAPAQAAGPCATATTQGCWSTPFSPGGEFDLAPPATKEDSMKDPAAASMVMLPNGRIEYWNGLQNLEDAHGPLPLDAGAAGKDGAKTGVLDLTGTGAPNFFLDASAPVGDDLFCTDQRLTTVQTPDGPKFQAIAVGGTHWETEVSSGPVGDNGGPRGLAELYGSHNQHVLTGASASSPGSTWTLGPDLQKGRWYPSMVTMPDGRQLIVGGVTKLLWNSSLLDSRATDITPYNVNQTEIRATDGSTTLNPSRDDASLPLFARIHLLPNGSVFYSGAGQMWGPAGEAMDEAEWNKLRAIDTTTVGTGTSAGWQTVGAPATLGLARSGAFSQMLPLRPDSSGNYTEAKILVGGGVLGDAPGTYLATNLAEIITVQKTGTTWSYSTERSPDLLNRRWFSSAVTLPDGEVAAFNGADADEVIMPGPEHAVRAAEIWTGTEWKPLGSSGRDRTYHNTAMLLPDGSILVAGHAPINQGYGASGAASTIGGANGFKDPSFERVFPPYLYAGPRPVIQTGDKHGTWGGTLHMTTNGGAAIAKIVLSRLPSVTHTTDADARTVELPGFTQGSGASISAQIPSDRNVLPPGYYYTFAMSAAGVPSVATVVQIGDPADYAGGWNATPVNMTDAWTPAASAPVLPAGLPRFAAKSAPASIAVTATEPRTTATVAQAARSAVPAGKSATPWLITLGALMGAVLLRRARMQRA